MKKLFAILAAIVALCFVSCTKGGVLGGLNGTTWVASETFTEQGVTVSESLTLTFSASTFQLNFAVTYNGHNIEEPGVTGTYTLSGSTVVLTAKDQETGKDETITGTISGNKMTFKGGIELEGFNGSKDLVFTKK